MGQTLTIDITWVAAGQGGGRVANRRRSSASSPRRLQNGHGHRPQAQPAASGPASLSGARSRLLDAHPRRAGPWMAVAGIPPDLSRGDAPRLGPLQVWCPTYCLMPDHLHLLWMGLRRASDQLNAMKFLHARLTMGHQREWRHQAHDHVLREEERKRNVFAQTCFYILANPVRAKLSEEHERWPFSGSWCRAIPRLHPEAGEFWPLFWELYAKQRETESPP